MKLFEKSFNEDPTLASIARKTKQPHHENKLSKKKWIQLYAGRMIKFWSGWASPLGISRDYLAYLADSLAQFYDEPLKRAFIERTYQNAQ